MIERTEIEGRSCTVAYLMDDFTPADKDDYEQVKIIFDDGEVRFARPVDQAEPGEDETGEDETDEPDEDDDDGTGIAEEEEGRFNGS